jgi:hypothetical protein
MAAPTAAATSPPATSVPAAATPPVPAAATPPVPAAATPPVPAATPAPTSVVVSDLLGDWRFQAETGERDIVGTLRFSLEASELTGKYIGAGGAATNLANLKLDGNHISWDLVSARGTWQLQGTVQGSSMNGTFQTITRTITWSAFKDGAAATPAASPTPR